MNETDLRNVLKYLSVCSGIEAASVAWHRLGWVPVAFSEIEPFPSAVLAHHYPTVPNRGDMTKFNTWPDESIDLLCGGTPCQAFSVAGLRKGLDDPRGNLTLTFLALARKYRPRWVVWENVPGVLSDRGNAFGQFLGGLGELGYGWAYRVLDAQFFGVAQRRRRVFVVGYLGDWRRASAVLFEPESLRGDSAPSREPGKRVTGTLSARTEGGGGLGTDFDRAGGVIAADVAPTLNAHFGDKQGLENQHINGGGACSLPATARALTTKNQRNDFETETLLPMRRGGFFDVADPICANEQRTTSHSGNNPRPRNVVAVAHALRGEGFDASEDGTGRGTPLVSVPTCFSAKDYGADAGSISPTLRAGGHTGSHPNGGVMPAVAIDLSVRRLTPRECERLQGFPDLYTDIPWRGKRAPDGPRYKALGNSWAVPCPAWIGRRIAIADTL